MSSPAEVRDVGPPALEARGLIRDFGALRAVDGVSFSLARGELLSVFGPNGAGKTSLLRLLGGGLHPTEGRVLVAGEPLEDGDGSARRVIGVLSHQGFLYGRLTALENLRFYGRLYGLTDLEHRMDRGLREVGLTQWAQRPVRTYSRGMRQRLALARTLLHDPDVVLLDEPYTGLDAHASALLNDVLARLKDGHRTVVLVTHNLLQGLELADRLAIQVRGRFVWEGRREEVRRTKFEAFYRKVVDGRVGSPGGRDGVSDRSGAGSGEDAGSARDPGGHDTPPGGAVR